MIVPGKNPLSVLAQVFPLTVEAMRDSTHLNLEILEAYHMTTKDPIKCAAPRAEFLSAIPAYGVEPVHFAIDRCIPSQALNGLRYCTVT